MNVAFNRIQSFAGVRINLRSFLGNPFYLFSFALLMTVILYHLRWSNYFKPVDGDFIVFVSLAFLIFSLSGWLLRNRINRLDEKPESKPGFHALFIVTAFQLFFFTAEFLYNKKIPLFDLLDPASAHEYRNFVAFPFLHYIAFAVGLFVVTVLYGRFVDTKSWKYIGLLVLNVLPYVLLFNRAFFILAIGLCVIYSVLRRRQIKMLNLILLCILVLVLLYGFGVAGNFREQSQEYAVSLKINESYPTWLPKEYFWPYMYATIPIANLQHNIMVSSPVSPDFLGLFFFEMLPAKERMSGVWGRLGLVKRTPAEAITGSNVGTIFWGAFSYAGWWGMVAMSLFLLLMLTVMTRLLSIPSPYSLITLSVLCVFALFSLFDNMFSLTPMALLLFFSIMCHIRHIKSSQNRSIQ